MIGLIVTILICGMTIISVNDKSARKNELEYAVAAAVQQSTKEMCYSTESNLFLEEIIKSKFVQNLCTNIQSKEEIEVSFYGIDYKKGLLDVEVTAEFVNLAGKKEKISVRKTAICE